MRTNKSKKGKKYQINFLNIFSYALFLPILFLILIFPAISEIVSPHLTSNLNSSLWLVFLTSILFAVFSIAFAGFTYLSNEKENNKNLNGLLRIIIKKSPQIFLFQLVYIIFFSLSNIISFTLAFIIGKSLNLSTTLASLIYFIFLFLAYLILLIFILYAPFIIILRDKKLIQSIYESFRMVKKDYLYALSISITYFLLTTLISYTYKINEFIPIILNVCIVLPSFFLILSKHIQKLT